MIKSKLKKETIDDLKAYYGYPPYHVITNTLREDPYYLVSILEKHKAVSLQELEKRVDFDFYHQKRQKEVDSWK